MHKSWRVTPNVIEFENWAIYSDQLINYFDRFTVYDISLTDSWTYPATDRKTLLLLPKPKRAYFSYTYHQSQLHMKTKSVRQTFYDVFRSFGSLLAFTRYFTLLGISRMQNFSLANSLIKKLYSFEDKKENDDTCETEQQSDFDDDDSNT